MFLRRMIAGRYSRTKYGLPGQWVKEVSLHEGMEHGRAMLCLEKCEWLVSKENDEEGELCRRNHKDEDSMLSG